MSLIYNIVAEKLANSKNKPYTLVINQDVINLGTESKPRLVRVVLKQESYGDVVKIGVYKKEGKNMVMVTSDEMLANIDAMLTSKSFEGIDLSQYVQDKSLKITVYHDFKILHIMTPAYDITKQIATLENRGQSVIINRVPMDIGTQFRLADAFEIYALKAYSNIVNLVLLKKLKSLQAAKFYLALDAYLPVNIYGTPNSFIFNPFVFIPRIRDDFRKTFIFQASEATKISFNELTISFLTSKEICLGLGLNKFLKFRLPFYLAVLSGCYSSYFANNDVHLYVYIGDAEERGSYPPALTSQQYRENISWAEGQYVSMSTLENLCRASYKSLGLGDNQRDVLISMMKNKALKYV